MNCYYSMENQDIDGNRGMRVLNCEIDDDDTEAIVNELYERFLEMNSEGTHTVTLTSEQFGEDVEIEVKLDDYIKELVEKFENDYELNWTWDKEDYDELSEFVEKVKASKES